MPVAGAIALVLSACSSTDGPVDPRDDDAAEVATVLVRGGSLSRFDPPALTVLGGTARLLVWARNASDSVVCSVAALGCASRLLEERFEWTMAPPGVVSLEEANSGLHPNGAVYLTALAEGRVEVTASVQGVRGTVALEVVERARVAWSLPTLGQVRGIAIGRDGTIYVAGRDGLQAVGPEGQVRWSLPRGAGVRGAPAIGDDGTLYLASTDSLVAIEPGGDVLWTTAMEEIRSTPAVGPAGNLHVLTGDGSLYAVSPTGEIAWSFRVPGLADRIPAPPAIGQDGTIYVGSWDHNLYAIGPDGGERWRFLTAGPVRAPTIGADGTVYVASTRERDPVTFTVPSDLLALDPDRTERWRVVLGGHVEQGPALGPGGTITVASDDSIYALGPGGAKLWTALLGSVHAPILAEDGSIYLGHPILSALDPAGEPRWEYGTRGGQDTAPAIGLDGTLYAGTYDGVVARLLAFTEPGVSNGGYAAAPWPQPRGDRANTGRAPRDP